METEETKFCTDTVVGCTTPEKQEPVLVSTLFLKATESEATKSQSRPTWDHPMEYICATLSYIIGYGMIWRFPYLMYRNGGFTFLVGYCLVFAIVGVPMFFLETYIGQFTSNGILTCWEMFPLFKGIGLAIFLICSVTALYYPVINSWFVYYLFATLRKGELPWATCANAWNTPNCHKLGDSSYNVSSNNQNGDFDQIKVDPADEYWLHAVLKISSGIENIGVPQWYLVLSLLATWIGTAAVLTFGPKIYGKISYLFMCIFPLLIILMIRFITLPGASSGLKYLFYPNITHMGKLNFWLDALAEVLFTLGVGFGPLITLASYSKFRNDCIRDTFLISTIYMICNLMSSITIMSLIGYMAHSHGVYIHDLMSSGPSLAFVVLPSAITGLPISQMWSALFFLLAIIIGSSSLVAVAETVITAILDLYPKMHKLRFLVVITVSVLGFLLNLPLTANGGIYLFTLVDWYIYSNIYLIVFTEVFCVAAMYGIFIYVFPHKKLLHFKDDLSVMLGGKGFHCIPWLFCWPILSFFWIIICPIILAIAWFNARFGVHPVMFGNYRYPAWALSFGHFLAWSPVILLAITPIPLVIMRLVKRDTLSEALEYLIRPTEFWGPALLKYHNRWKDYSGNNNTNKEPLFTTLAGHKLRLL